MFSWNKQKALLALVMLVAFMLYAMAFSQYLAYLDHLQMPLSLRTVTLVGAAISGMVLQFLMGYVSDKYQTIKPLVFISLVGLVLAGFLGYACQWPLLSFYAGSIGATIAIFRVSSNLIETWLVQINEETARHFGSLRMFGCLGWSLGALITGRWVQAYGYPVLGLSMIGLLVFVSILLLFCPDSQRGNQVDKVQLKDWAILFKNKDFLWVVFIYLIVFLVYNLDGLTLVDKLLDLKVSAEGIGAYFMIIGLVEVPMMLLGRKLLDRFSSIQLMMASVLCLGLRYLLYGLSQNLTQILLISLFQMVNFPIFLLTQKIMVNQLVDARLNSSGHMMMTSITSNVPILCLPILTALLSQWWTHSQILMAGGLLCLLPLVFLYRLSVKSVDEKSYQDTQKRAH